MKSFKNIQEGNLRLDNENFEDIENLSVPKISSLNEEKMVDYEELKLRKVTYYILFFSITFLILFLIKTFGNLELLNNFFRSVEVMILLQVINFFLIIGSIYSLCRRLKVIYIIIFVLQFKFYFILGSINLENNK
jgi:hypothetical protein